MKRTNHDSRYFVGRILGDMEKRKYFDYENKVKRFMDKGISFVGMVILMPVFVVLSAAIYIDDPGAILFTQERVGKGKKLFTLHKFRTMKRSTPHDVPTHQLTNPEQYITRVGKFLRKYSLDELPQIWDIFAGDMSIIGPRPALWNQDDLVAERDKYGANDILPGLTGWAQINGRDELEIPEKAKLDGVYVSKLKQGGFKALFFDVRCFLGTIFSVLGSEGVVEGGTGEMRRKEKKPHILVVSQYFYPETFRINDIAEEWVKRGYQVTVLTGIPNYPMGKFFEGYGLRRRRRESKNGIDIIRIPLIPRGNSANKAVNSLGMIANYLSFVISGWWWNVTTNIRADLVFTFEVSPMTQALIGVWYAKKRHIPHLLYVQDLWPENVEAVTGIKSSMLLYPVNRMVDYIYKNTDQIFTTSKSFVRAIVNRDVKVDQKKVHYWPQYAEMFYEPLDREKVKSEAETGSSVRLIPDDGAFHIAFTGNIGTAQGLHILPKTAEKLKKLQTERAVRFVIVGDGRYQEAFEKEIKKRKVEERFVLIPRQKAEEIPKLLACCDAAFLSFADKKLWEMTIPAKLQSYMACGIPVIAAAKGETEQVIGEAACGICVPIGDVDGLVRSIQEMVGLSKEERKKLGNNGKSYCEIHYNKTALMDRMERYLRVGGKERK